MKYAFVINISFLFIIVLFNELVFASDDTQRDLKVSLPYLPVLSESREKGTLVYLVEEMNNVYEGNILITGFFPFKRSISNVLYGIADFHMPILMNPDLSGDKTEYMHSTETLFQVVFALYTKKGRTIDLDRLSSYIIEVERAHVDLFSFPVIPSSTIDQSLRKLDKNRIDAFIFAAKETDEIVEKLGLTSKISSSFYKSYETKFVLPKGKEGVLTDRALSSIIKKMKKSGKFQEIFAPITTYYDNWKSSE